MRADRLASLRSLALLGGRTLLKLAVGFFSSLLWLVDTANKALARFNRRILPKGLYGRSLIIVVAPIVILQSVIAFVFMERHWQMVTDRLSAAVVQDIAAMIDIYRASPDGANAQAVKNIARTRLNLLIEFLPREPLPAPGPKPFFDVLDTALSREINLQIGRPFWIDTVGTSSLVEIRIQLEGAVMQILAPRNQAYASNSHIFLMWMAGTSLVLIVIAIIFLRRPDAAHPGAGPSGRGFRQGPRCRQFSVPVAPARCGRRHRPSSR